MESLETLPWEGRDERSTQNVSGDFYALQIIIFGYILWIKYAL